MILGKAKCNIQITYNTYIYHLQFERYFKFQFTGWTAI